MLQEIHNYDENNLSELKTKAKDIGDLYEDDISNGKKMVLPWGYEVYLPNDTVVVELYTLDKSTYIYYKTLYQIAGDGSMMSMSTPANPVTNIALNRSSLTFLW